MYDIKCNIFYFKVAKEILLECGNRASECRLFGTKAIRFLFDEILILILMIIDDFILEWKTGKCKID